MLWGHLQALLALAANWEREGELAFIEHLLQVRSMSKAVVRLLSLGPHNTLRGGVHHSQSVGGYLRLRIRRGLAQGLPLNDLPPSLAIRNCLIAGLKIHPDFLLCPPMVVPCPKNSPPSNTLPCWRWKLPPLRWIFKGLAEEYALQKRKDEVLFF